MEFGKAAQKGAGGGGGAIIGEWTRVTVSKSTVKMPCLRFNGPWPLCSEWMMIPRPLTQHATLHDHLHSRHLSQAARALFFLTLLSHNKKKKKKKELRVLVQTLFIVHPYCSLECFSNKFPRFHIHPFTAKQPSNWEWSVLKTRVSHGKLLVALLAPLDTGRVASTGLLPLLMTFGGKRV